MRAFTYTRPRDIDNAVVLGQSVDVKYIAGGTNLLDLMKSDVERPSRLVDINHLAMADIEQLPQGWLRLGALARNSAVAQHPLVRKQYPLLSQALLSGASPQLRNMATVGGNLLQRTRCGYFTDIAFAMCNKRNPGSGCAALNGRNRMHAILGADESCIATHPSDMSVALAALDALVRIRGPRGDRTVPVAEFYRPPGTPPDRETQLQTGELVVAVDLPPTEFDRNVHYLKLRDRASYAFALVSVAAALKMDRNGTVRSARIALGGVAPRPWRVPDAEQMLVGKNLSPNLLQSVAAVMVKGARPYAENKFKIALAQRAVVRALTTAGAST